jgi:predicted ArsR family transcriptional regulator
MEVRMRSSAGLRDKAARIRELEDEGNFDAAEIAEIIGCGERYVKRHLSNLEHRRQRQRVEEHRRYLLKK